jgi:hypothetical protein
MRYEISRKREVEIEVRLRRRRGERRQQRGKRRACPLESWSMGVVMMTRW